MKTDEEKGKYGNGASEMEDSTNNALTMLGAGYRQPSIEIEGEKTVIERHAGKNISVAHPAYIKLSTAFKGELCMISGDALKVWIFIALSINRKTGTANPGLRTIATAVKLSVNTVQKALKDLEELDLLTVDRESRRYNLYETPEYVSANKANPSVSNHDTDAPTVSNSNETVSKSDTSLQNPLLSVIHNHSNHNKPDLVDGILEQARRSVEATQKGTAWKFRNEFSFNADILPLADLCVKRFGEPARKDLALWIAEIGSWVDAGVRERDWVRAEELVAAYTTPVMSITGMTKALKFAAQERKNGNSHREPSHPEWEKVKPDPNEGKYVKAPPRVRNHA